MIIFKAPNDPERVQAWAAAIPGDRQFTSREFICEKHFSSSMMRRDKYYGVLGGQVILDHPKKPGLLPDAVPCVFLPSPAPPKKKRIRRGASSSISQDAVKRSGDPGTSTAVGIGDVNGPRGATESRVGRMLLSV